MDTKKRRYSIRVYAKRGRQPCYTYDAYPSKVKAAKVEDIVLSVAEDILSHEHVRRWRGSLTQLGSGYIIRVWGNRFIVRRV